MPTSARKRLVVAVLLAAAVGLGAASSRVQWRLRLVARKIDGSLPALNWAEVIRRVAQSGARIRAVGNGEEPCPVLWSTPLGSFWGRQTDGHLLEYLTEEQLEQKIYERAPVVVRAGDVVVDAGAHIGTFSRYALDRGARLVVAVEPSPTGIVCLKRTFRAELQTGRLVVVEAALWEAAGTLRLMENRSNSGMATVMADQKEANRVEYEVRATALDEVVRQLKLDRLDFIKMDIEGAERHALRGGRESISRFGPRMALCVYHGADDAKVIPEIVRAARPAYQYFTVGGQAYFH